MTDAKIAKKTLDPAHLPLQGRHLIEASAGTGKTYNIIRLYLRLLLEKKLTVQQILVMTFTRAATEELRGRIDEALRQAIAQWGSLGTDPFFREMEARFTPTEATSLLRPALLELDEASIFTIHGFCNRVLTQQAFASGIAMDVVMEADTNDLRLEAVRDWLRRVNRDELRFSLLADKNWHDPLVFAGKFDAAIKGANLLTTPELTDEEKDDYAGKATALPAQKAALAQHLLAIENELLSAVVEAHQNLKSYWPQLIAWLQGKGDICCERSASGFQIFNRYNKPFQKVHRPLIAELKTLIAEAKKLSDLEARNRDIGRAKLVVTGISEIRQQCVRDKARQGVMDFDDLIVCLNARVRSAEGEALVELLRQQYPVALVDEFQDTDPLQYGILDQIYAQTTEGYSLMMIGDPKQAIYGFRGGDIFAYLEARQHADYHWHMDTNWRSVASMVTGYNRLFWGAELSSDSPVDVFGYGIGYEQIKSTEKASAVQRRFTDPQEDRRAMNYVWLPEVTNPSGARGAPVSDDYQQGLANWCVGEISRLLAEAKLGGEAVRQADIAVLVRTGTEAAVMQESLANAGLPSVYLSNKENILESEEAWELLTLLAGIWECENDRLLTAALSTHMLGGDAAQLARYRDPLYEDQWEAARNRAFEWRELWQKKSCMAMLMTLVHEHYHPHPGRHERSLTNTLHLMELLQDASRKQKHPQQLIKWFRDQLEAGTAGEEAEQRLESDARLIRIITQHGSKGLEYPLVFVPFASKSRDPAKALNTYLDYYKYHDPDSRELRNQVAHSVEAIKLVREEGYAEAKRLLYVAVTRAAYRCYLGVAPFKGSDKSPLGLVLDLPSVGTQQQMIGAWQQMLTDLQASAESSSMLLTVDDQQVTTGVNLQPPEADELVVSRLTETIDDHWRLSSFSALSRNVHSLRQNQKEHADQTIQPVNAAREASTSEPLPLRFTLKKGAATGNLLHDILEHTDFAEPQWESSVAGPVLRFGGLPETEQAELIAWLEQCLHTFLPAIDGKEQPFRLADLPWHQTLRESEFYFPMNSLDMQGLMKCLQRHRNSQQPIPFPGEAHLEGMMHGFIDLIFQHKGRFYLADYKSTHLGDDFKDYEPAELKRNNEYQQYDLQYLIYTVALNRYLARQISGYMPEQHFGGVYYFYLRGMAASNAQPLGVFYTAIDTELLQTLDKAFGSPETGKQAKVVR